VGALVREGDGCTVGKGVQVMVKVASGVPLLEAVLVGKGVDTGTINGFPMPER